MPLPPIAIAWLAKEAVGGGAGLLDAILYHMGYDENNWLRRWTDSLDEISTFNRLAENWGLAPRRADTPLGEHIGSLTGWIDWLVPVGAVGKAGTMMPALANAVNAARASGIFAELGRGIVPQQFPKKPINIPTNNNQGNQAAGGQGNQAVGVRAPIGFPGVGNMGDIIAQNLNTAASMYPHLWAAAVAEQARRDREQRLALEQALRAYAAQSSWMFAPQFQYQTPAFW